MGLETFGTQNLESAEHKKENIEEIVNSVIDMNLLAAAKFLPEGELRDQIIKFYSDPERLTTELKNVFQRMDEQQFEKWMEQTEQLTSNEELFVEYANKQNFSTNQEERAQFEASGTYH